MVLAAFAILWLGLATWLLPPRGVDDLTYHLPPLYEAVRTGEIPLLPLRLRDQFAMPLGGAFLFLWPMVFLHTDTWIDGIQLVAALYAALIVYGLGRTLALTRHSSAYAALLFLLTPVVLAQAGSNYVDLILTASHLTLIYAAVRFWQTGGWLPLAMAGLAAGFGLGIKYSMLLAVIVVLPLLLVRLARDGGVLRFAAGIGVFLAAAVPLPAYWLARNFLRFGHVLYPYQLTITGLQAAPGSNFGVNDFELAPAFGNSIVHLVYNTRRFFLYLLEDPGLGSLNGGFGLVFFGLGVPALIYCGLRACRALVARDWFPLLFWGQAVAVLLVTLLQTDVTRLRFNMRLMLVLVPFAVLAMGVVLDQLRAELPALARGLRLLGIAGALLAVLHLAGHQLPSYQLGAAVVDRVRGTSTSPYRYLDQGIPILAPYADAWDPLDYLSGPGGGWTVYMAAPRDVFWTSPAYGSRIQNTVWNFLDAPVEEPDAIVIHRGLTGQELIYVGRAITPVEVARNPDYELVRANESTELWVRRARLNEPGMRARLAEYNARRPALAGTQ